MKNCVSCAVAAWVIAVNLVKRMTGSRIKQDLTSTSTQRGNWPLSQVRTAVQSVYMSVYMWRIHERIHETYTWEQKHFFYFLNFNYGWSFDQLLLSCWSVVGGGVGVGAESCHECMYQECMCVYLVMSACIMSACILSWVHVRVLCLTYEGPTESKWGSESNDWCESKLCFAYFWIEFDLGSTIALRFGILRFFSWRRCFLCVLRKVNFYGAGGRLWDWLVGFNFRSALTLPRGWPQDKKVNFYGAGGRPWDWSVGVNFRSVPTLPRGGSQG